MDRAAGDSVTPDRAEPADLVAVQCEDFEPGMHIEALRAAPGRTTPGAIVSFVGLVRDMSGGFPVERMSLEHYPGMTEKSLAAIVAQARSRWPLDGVRLIHRVGTLAPGDRIVMVAVSSAHRGAAFDACGFIVDFLKTEAPFWKRESGSAGVRWVEARESDEAARARWGGPSGTP